MTSDDGGLPVYSTRALVDHLDQVCRSILDSHLEEGEVAYGVGIDVRHREFVPVGEKIVLEATVASVEPHRLTCEIMVRHRGSVAIRATYEMELLARDSLRSRIAGRSIPTAS